MTIKRDHKGRKYYVIFRPYRVDKRTGRVLYAKAYGIKAWPIRVYI